MTEEELKRIVRETRLSNVSLFSDEPIWDLMNEIYCAGYLDGYNNTVGISNFVEYSIFDCHVCEYLNKNLDKICKRLDAIYEYQKGFSKAAK